MPKAITASICELCGAVYKSQAEAEKCEHFHKTVDVLKTMDASYDLTTSEAGFPATVLIETIDGSNLRATYSYVSEEPSKKK